MGGVKRGKWRRLSRQDGEKEQEEVEKRNTQQTPYSYAALHLQQRSGNLIKCSLIVGDSQFKCVFLQVCARSCRLKQKPFISLLAN